MSSLRFVVLMFWFRIYLIWLSYEKSFKPLFPGEGGGAQSLLSWDLESHFTTLTIHYQWSMNNLGIQQHYGSVGLNFQTSSDGNWTRFIAIKWKCTKLISTRILNLALSNVFLRYPHLYLYWVFAANLFQHRLYRCRLSIDPYKVKTDLGNLEPAEEGHQFNCFFPSIM